MRLREERFKVSGLRFKVQFAEVLVAGSGSEFRVLWLYVAEPGTFFSGCFEDSKENLKP